MMRRHFLMQLVCLLVCCNLPMFAQREQSYGDLMTPQLRSDRSGAPAPGSLVQGTGGFNVAFKSTTQFAQFNYAQTFETGTNVQALVTSTNSFSNNSLYFFNPYITSALVFQFTQPLWRNGWRFANQAPLVIA